MPHLDQREEDVQQPPEPPPLDDSPRCRRLPPRACARSRTLQDHVGRRVAEDLFGGVAQALVDVGCADRRVRGGEEAGMGCALGFGEAREEGVEREGVLEEEGREGREGFGCGVVKGACGEPMWKGERAPGHGQRTLVKELASVDGRARRFRPLGEDTDELLDAQLDQGGLRAQATKSVNAGRARSRGAAAKTHHLSQCCTLALEVSLAQCFRRGDESLNGSDVGLEVVRVGPAWASALSGWYMARARDAARPALMRPSSRSTRSLCPRRPSMDRIVDSRSAPTRREEVAGVSALAGPCEPSMRTTHSSTRG